MNLRSRKWKIAAAIFAVANLGGAVYAVAELGEVTHAVGHLGLIVLVVLFYFPRRGSGSTRATTASVETASVDDAVARLEQALESVAVNVERVGEAQRFHVKVLEDRARAE